MIHILTGPVHSGKTTLLQKVTSQLKRQNISVAGFLSLYAEDGEKFIGYDLYDLRKEIRTPFIRKNGEKHWQRVGPYFFIPESLDLAQDIIRQSTDAEMCAIDEVGPLELEGKGLWPAIKEVLASSNPDYIFIVRETMIADLLKTLGEVPVRIFDISDKELLAIMVHYFTNRECHKRSN